MSVPYRCNPNVEAVRIDGEYILMHADRYTVTKLNELGGICWELLGEAGTVEQLALKVHERFNVPIEEAAQDVQCFLDELMRIGLVQHAG